MSLASVSHFDTLATKRKNTVFIALLEKNINIKKSFQNFGNIAVGEIRSLNPVDVLTYKYLIVLNPKEAVAILEKKTNMFKNLKPKSTASPTGK